MHRIAILGGTGRTGRGLAVRLLQAGHHILIGSRDAARAAEVAQKVEQRAGTTRSTTISSGTNESVAAGAELLIAAIPYAGQDLLLQQIAPGAAGKILVSVAVPVEFIGGIPMLIAPAEGSAAQQAAILVPRARVVGGFHTVSSAHLSGKTALNEDVLLCSDDDEAKAVVAEIVSSVEGLRAVDAGPLRNARITEELAVLLLEINRRRQTTAGIKITETG